MDAARDEFIEELSRELYDQHIEDFVSERLKSYYIRQPDVMRPAVDALQEGRWQLENGRNTPALVFCVSAIELLLKATVLRPLVSGLVHDGRLADAIVNEVAQQSGYVRYFRLLKVLFEGLGAGQLGDVRRASQSESLLSECETLQKLRNDAVHKGIRVNGDEAERARAVAVDVFELIVRPMLSKLGLTVGERGVITPAQGLFGT